MTLSEDGPPTCPGCGATTVLTWNYCASCGHQLRDPEDRPGTLPKEPDPPLNHRNVDHLRWAYQEHDSIAAAAELFEVTYPTVRNSMVEHGVHDPG